MLNQLHYTFYFLENLLRTIFFFYRLSSFNMIYSHDKTLVKHISIVQINLLQLLYFKDQVGFRWLIYNQ